MKKAILFIVALICSIGTLNAQTKTDLQEYELLGEVKKITEISYDTKEYFGEWIKGDSTTIEVKEFNSNGYITRNKYSFKIEEEYDYCIINSSFNYDENGNLIEVNHYDSDDSLDSVYVNVYNSDGNQLEQANYNSDGSLSQIVIFAYDLNGNCIEQATYNSDGSLSYKTVNHYDANGNLTDKATYNTDGFLTLKIQVDKNGNNIETIFYAPDGSIEHKSKHVYDDEEKLIEDVMYKSELFTERNLYFYNDRTLRIWEQYLPIEEFPRTSGSKLVLAPTLVPMAPAPIPDPPSTTDPLVVSVDSNYCGEKNENASRFRDGLLRQRSLFNDKGHIEESIYFGADESIESKEIYSYEYDTNGNWIKRTRSKEVNKFGNTYPEPQEITIRDITYY